MIRERKFRLDLSRGNCVAGNEKHQFWLCRETRNMNVYNNRRRNFIAKMLISKTSWSSNYCVIFFLVVHSIIFVLLYHIIKPLLSSSCFLKLLRNYIHHVVWRKMTKLENDLETRRDEWLTNNDIISDSLSDDLVVIVWGSRRYFFYWSLPSLIVKAITLRHYEEKWVRE